MKVTTYVEQRPAIDVVKWMGDWDEAHEFTRYFGKVTGFEVSTEGAIRISFVDSGNLILQRGAHIEVRPGWPGNGRWEFVRLLQPGDLDGYRAADKVEG